MPSQQSPESPPLTNMMPASIRTVPTACRTALAEIPPVLQDIQLKEHRLEGLDSNDLWELTRKCHRFRSIDLSGWKGVSVLSFRSLCLSVGSSLQTVSLLDKLYFHVLKKVLFCRLKHENTSWQNPIKNDKQWEC